MNMARNLDPSNSRLEFRRADADGFVFMKAGPCPFLIDGPIGKTQCSAHSIRPYNCRRFQCQRPDPKVEAFEHGGDMGCRNLSDRVDNSRVARRQYEVSQRRAQKVARGMGWSD